jgi:flagellar hook assembly protein FlgD
MKVVLPNNEKVAEAKIVIYDNIGNVVFETETRGDKAVWSLTNTAGRKAANGTYLVVAEAKNTNGKVYRYSAKVGVKK